MCARKCVRCMLPCGCSTLFPGWVWLTRHGGGVLQTAHLILATAPFCTFLVAWRVAALFGCCQAGGRQACVAGTPDSRAAQRTAAQPHPPQPVSSNHVPSSYPGSVQWLLGTASILCTLLSLHLVRH